MKSILLDLYYGNYSVISKRLPRDSAYARALHAVCDLEDELTERLTGEQKELFRSYLDAQVELAGEEVELYFIEGCKLGARLALEMLQEAWKE